MTSTANHVSDAKLSDEEIEALLANPLRKAYERIFDECDPSDPDAKSHPVTGSPAQRTHGALGDCLDDLKEAHAALRTLLAERRARLEADHISLELRTSIAEEQRGKLVDCMGALERVGRLVLQSSVASGDEILAQIERIVEERNQLRERERARLEADDARGDAHGKALADYFKRGWDEADRVRAEADERALAGADEVVREWVEWSLRNESREEMREVVYAMLRDREIAHNDRTALRLLLDASRRYQRAHSLMRSRFQDVDDAQEYEDAANEFHGAILYASGTPIPPPAVVETREPDHGRIIELVRHIAQQRREAADLAVIKGYTQDAPSVAQLREEADALLALLRERDELRERASKAELRVLSLYTPLWEHGYDCNDYDAQAIVSKALRENAQHRDELRRVVTRAVEQALHARDAADRGERPVKTIDDVVDAILADFTDGRS